MRSFTHRVCDNDAKEKDWRGDSLQGPWEQGVVLIKISVISALRLLLILN